MIQYKVVVDTLVLLMGDLLSSVEARRQAVENI